MEEHGEFLIPASRNEVWRALQDPLVLKQCIDGCEQMTVINADEFECAVTVKIGPVKARFNGTISILEAVQPESYTLKVAAEGGAAGFGQGQAHVQLHETNEGTRLTYAVEGSIGGKLAQIGSRLIQSFSRKMARSFFESFSKQWVA